LEVPKQNYLHILFGYVPYPAKDTDFSNRKLILHRYLFAVIYCFGIKEGIGADSLSAFFHLLHLEERIGCSASALRQLEIEVKEKIIAYRQSCPSLPDVFHLLYALSKSMWSAIARQKVQLQHQQQALQAKLNTNSSAQVSAQIED